MKNTHWLAGALGAAPSAFHARAIRRAFIPTATEKWSKVVKDAGVPQQ